MENEEKLTENSNEIIYGHDHLEELFNSMAYLHDFYERIEDPAMQLVLLYLPIIAERLSNFNNLLDFGAGPTIHVAVIFRKKADNIFLADYLAQNRQELVKWMNNCSEFDWSLTIKKIATVEGLDWSQLPQIENDTRKRVRDIFFCDCHRNPSVNAPPSLMGNFDAVVTIFCIEYCCNTIAEYKQAAKNIIDQVKPGGIFVMGGILRETWCSYGNRKFSCLYLTEEEMIETLRECGLLIDDQQQTIYYNVHDMFLLCTRKKS